MESTDSDRNLSPGSADANRTELKYEETLMYGTYTDKLSKCAKDTVSNRPACLDVQERIPLRSVEQGVKCQPCLTWLKGYILYHLGGDYVFLLLLGISMALLSFAMDYAIQMCRKAHYYLYKELEGYVALQFLTWVSFPLVFIIFSVGFVHVLSPQAIGSGIPEMKTIMRGVVLQEYLTFRVLVAKMVGLVASLGSRLPIGKEGPFVHIASIVATLLDNLLSKVKARPKLDGYRNEMLAAACAVGVACNFAAPIGGVLFSIEVTATYFAVRDYWRGFFGAVCGAFIFRLLAVWRNEEETITALFRTNFRLEFPYDLQEFIGFTAIGVLCGFGGAFFVYLHRLIVNFHRDNTCVKNCLGRSRFLYPAIVTLIISSIKFPSGFGQFLAGELTLKEAVDTLFDNKTWNKLGYIDESDVLSDIQKGWEHPTVNIYVTLCIFIFMYFIMTAFAITLPVPAGVFMPVFVIGAAFGRLIGETMSAFYPKGFYSIETSEVYKVVPGGYAVVGAASLSGAVTHTVSTAVIVFELTGQISHILPVMIAVLISNLIAQRLQPSIYDSIIEIKELPFLPDITRGKRKLRKILVEDFMLRNFKYFTLQSTNIQIQSTLATCSAKSFPIVQSAEDMVLIGSISRSNLNQLMAEERSEWPDTSKQDLTSIDSNGLKEVLSDGVKNGMVTSHSAEADLKDVTADDIMKREKKGTRPPLPSAVCYPLIDLNEARLNLSPFQIVEKTPIHDVHSMFSLLGATKAFVTSVGRLVGVVTLHELRSAIEFVTAKEQKRKRETKKLLERTRYGVKKETLEFMALQQDESSDEDS